MIAIANILSVIISLNKVRKYRDAIKRVSRIERIKK